MAEEQPSNPVAGPPFEQWAPGYPPPPPKRSQFWPAIVVGTFVIAVAATIVAVVALVVATNRPPASGPTPTTSSPTYGAAEVSAAHQKLCDAYKLAARAVQIETNGENPALAGIATVNGALILEHALSTTPAIAVGDRTAAVALAEAYSNAQATAATVRQRDDPLWQSTIGDVNAKDIAMKMVCGRG